jgi:hypothetical protein
MKKYIQYVLILSVGLGIVASNMIYSMENAPSTILELRDTPSYEPVVFEGPYRKAGVKKAIDDPLYRKIAKATKLPLALVALIAEYFWYEAPQKLKVRLSHAGPLMHKGRRFDYMIEEAWYKIVLHHTLPHVISGEELVISIACATQFPRSLFTVVESDYRVSQEEIEKSSSSQNLEVSSHIVSSQKKYPLASLNDDYSFEIHLEKDGIESVRAIIKNRPKKSSKVCTYLMRAIKRVT